MIVINLLTSRNNNVITYVHTTTIDGRDVAAEPSSSLAATIVVAEFLPVTGSLYVKLLVGHMLVDG